MRHTVSELRHARRGPDVYANIYEGPRQIGFLWGRHRSHMTLYCNGGEHAPLVAALHNTGTALPIKTWRAIMEDIMDQGKMED